MGPWIEITLTQQKVGTEHVGPYMGPWIEIEISTSADRSISSGPTWARGLKCHPRIDT